MKYLKVWEQPIPHGRDQGYLETQMVIYDDLEQVAKWFGTQKNERFYTLQPVDIDNMKHDVEIAIHEINRKKEAYERAKKLAEYEKLKK